MKLNKKLQMLNTYPFHMPGHKRNKKFNIYGSDIDITEIDGYDNLHNPADIIKEVEDKLGNIYSCERSFMLVNGSTVGILSAVFAVCSEGDLVLVARNCHKSVYNACMLRKLKIVYIEPEYDSTNGFYKSIKQDTIDKAILKYPNARCVIITSPTYEGYISNIKCDIPVIVDSAHGAHMIMKPFNNYPSGDIVISSLHKTLPALTQSAVANIYNKDFIDSYKLYVDIFETSSPSYVIMDSIAKCVDYISENEKEFDWLYRKSVALQKIELDNLKILKTDDVSRTVISTANTNTTGIQFAQILREDFLFEVEMASINYVILILTIADDDEVFEMLEGAITEIDKNYCEKAECIRSIDKPNTGVGICTISIDEGEETDIENAVGKISNEFIFAYPPDIPILCPNEEITEDIVKYIRQATECNINLISDSGLLPNKILTKKKL